MSCDPETVARLTQTAITAMLKDAEGTTVSEIVSACLTLLDHTLKTIKRFQTPEERVQTTRELHKILTEFLLEHGSLPN